MPFAALQLSPANSGDRPCRRKQNVGLHSLLHPGFAFEGMLLSKLDHHTALGGSS
jgi:hypothetical protein